MVFCGHGMTIVYGLKISGSRRTSWARFQLSFVKFALGAGKTTLVKMLQAKCPDWHIVPEPVSEWTNISSNDNEV